VQRHLELPTAGGRNNAQDVEAARRRASTGQTPKVAPRDRYDVPLLTLRHRSGWRREAGVSSGLYFDETQNAFVPANQIDFAAIVRNPKVCGHESISQILQIEKRLGFTAFAQGQMLRSSRAATAAEPSQSANHELGEPCHKISDAIAAVTLIFLRGIACDDGHATLVGHWFSCFVIPAGAEGFAVSTAAHDTGVECASNV